MERVSRVYALIDPRNTNNEVRYVGITLLPLRRRLSRHRADARLGIKRPLCLWLKKLMGMDLTPAIVLLEETTDRQREVYWIAHYRAAGARLLNLTDGGEGVVGCLHTAEWKAKMSKAQRGRKRPPLTPEHRAAISASNRGKVKSAQTREKIGNAQRGKTQPPVTLEQREKMRAAQRGRKHPEEVKAKIRDSWTPQKRAQHAIVIKQAQIGRKPRPPRTAATRAKMSASGKGRKRSPETVAKIAATQRSLSFLSDDDIRLLRALHAAGAATVKELQVRFKCSNSHVRGIIEGSRRAL